MTANEAQLIRIEMPVSPRLDFSRQLQNLMNAACSVTGDRRAWLGMDLPADWPDNPDLEVTVAQLVQLAAKLKCRFVLRPTIRVEPLEGGS